jgi:hypothetical protein
VSVETALPRRDWLSQVVGVANVCRMSGGRCRGDGGGGCCHGDCVGGRGMEARGFRRPFGVNIIAWSFNSVGVRGQMSRCALIIRTVRKVYNTQTKGTTSGTNGTLNSFYPQDIRQTG